MDGLRVIQRSDLYELTWDTTEPVLGTDYREYRNNGIIFKNSGDSTVTLNKGWTIEPGDTLQLSPPSEYGILILNIAFVFTGGATDRVEVCEFTLNVPAAANYHQS